MILSKRLSAFSVPSSSAVPGCGIAGGSCLQVVSLEMPQLAVWRAQRVPLCPLRYQGLWEGAAGFQLSLQQLFPARGLPDSSALQIPDALEIFSPKIFFPSTSLGIDSVPLNCFKEADNTKS